jgi:hypothetical protein
MNTESNIAQTESVAIESVIELSELQLSLVGGGIGETILVGPAK